jgi:hypothetical protein
MASQYYEIRGRDPWRSSYGQISIDGWRTIVYIKVQYLDPVSTARNPSGNYDTDSVIISKISTLAATGN